MKLNKEEKKAIALLKQLDNFDDLCETCYYIDTERKTKYGCCGCREEAKDIVLNLIEKLQKENEEFKREIERQKDINIMINTKGIDKCYEKTLEKTMTKFLNNNVVNDFIPKKKIKDKIEELNKEIKSCDEINTIFKIKQQQILQELLEKEHEDD